MFMHWNGGQKEICDGNSLQWQSQEFAAGHATYKKNHSRGNNYESTKNSLSPNVLVSLKPSQLHLQAIDLDVF